MARTKQTARRSTGGGPPAKRRRLLKRDSSFTESSNEGEVSASEDGKSIIVTEKTEEVSSTGDDRYSHADITSYLTIKSDVIKIYVGIAPQAFAIHADLIAFHCEYFKKGSISKESIIKTENLSAITLPKTDNVIENRFLDVTPLAFAQLYSWLYHGTIPVKQRAYAQRGGPASDLEGLWILGAKLSSPGFQNVVLERLCEPARGGTWPSVEQAKFIYSQTAAGSKLRQFAAACLLVKCPFRSEEGSDMWLKVFAEYRAMNDDFLKQSGKWDGGRLPWAVECREEFACPLLPVRERWLATINERDQIEIANAASAGCIRSQLEREVSSVDGQRELGE